MLAVEGKIWTFQIRWQFDRHGPQLVTAIDIVSVSCKSPRINMPNNPGCPKDLEDAFVNVMFQEERNGETVNKGNDSFYDKFVEKGERSSVYSIYSC